MTYTWAEFKAAVFGFLTDRTPTDSTFAVAAQEYVRARIQLNLLGDKDGYALAERRYTQLRKALAGYQTTSNDATLQAAVKLLLRDTTAGDTMFTEAVANYVRVQSGQADRAGFYSSLRIRLAGFQTALSDASLKVAVRVLLSDGARNNQTFAQAVALFVRAGLAREVDARSEIGQGQATPAQAIAASCRAEYEQLRVKLAGFNHTLGGGLATEVAKYLPVDTQRNNTTAYQTVLIANAADDLQAYGGWLDGQILTAKTDLQGFDAWLNAEIAAAKEDIQSMNARIQKEIRSAVIDLQHFIRAYTLGHVDTFVEADVEQDGFASTGEIEDGMIRAASIIRNHAHSIDHRVQQGEVTPTVGIPRSLVLEETKVYSVIVVPDDGNVGVVLVGYDTLEPVTDAPLVLSASRAVVYDLAKVVVKTSSPGDKVQFMAVLYPGPDFDHETKCTLIAWGERREKMVNNIHVQARQIAVSPKGDAFMVTPAIEAGKTLLRLEWDGTKLDFDDTDDTPFDEGAAEAAGHFVNGKMSLEWGEAGGQIALHREYYQLARTKAYLKAKRRAEVNE